MCWIRTRKIMVKYNRQIHIDEEKSKTESSCLLRCCWRERLSNNHLLKKKVSQNFYHILRKSHFLYFMWWILAFSNENSLYSCFNLLVIKSYILNCEFISTIAVAKIFQILFYIIWKSIYLKKGGCLKIWEIFKKYNA